MFVTQRRCPGIGCSWMTDTDSRSSALKIGSGSRSNPLTTSSSQDLNCEVQTQESTTGAGSGIAVGIMLLRGLIIGHKREPVSPPPQKSTQLSDASGAPLQDRLTSIAPLQFNTRWEAQHDEVINRLPYLQQTRALPTANIRFSHRSTPVHVDIPEQESFCTPQGKIAPVDEELFAQTLKFKLWMLAKGLEAIGETERVCLTGIKSPTPKTDIEIGGWNIPGQASTNKKDSHRDYDPSIQRMHELRRG
ncbi:hypothetical protein B0J11DRAFT_512084 [Dendryphion nanum]|uniref:Uncharacterized protein n=1 Tax=Dendryphion nanum TaxID=256645 RepID=A0A9P9I9G5_9PLEO|nr:hypothetical protein B0J11DRAFT_512084 [Dendryphion nanum]